MASIFIVLNCMGKRATMSPTTDKQKAQEEAHRIWGSVQELSEEAIDSGCVDPSTNVYYRHHEERTGAGVCVRCGAVLDATQALPTKSNQGEE